MRVTSQITGEFRHPFSSLRVDGRLTHGSRRPNIYFNITSPTPGTFIIALHYKGREKAILEMDLNIDDLLEKVCCHQYYPYNLRIDDPAHFLQQKDNKHLLDLEYVQLNVPKVLGLLKKVFAKR